MSYQSLQPKQTKLEKHLERRASKCETWSAADSRNLAAKLRCPVCMDKIVNELLGCGHFICAECALCIKLSGQPFCPLCNTKISQAQAVFFN